ncbi:hypothetical protein V5O48_013179 [Marasmius crinis-equi]|uniref:Uncharacterized protein n=1 Tax=Marasmius crinis-equi TaxID=585013 RepID=A0ABR3F0R3_9AGAR
MTAFLKLWSLNVPGSMILGRDPLEYDGSVNIWIDSQSGTVSLGPPGPPFLDSGREFLSWLDSPSEYPGFPALSLDMYDDNSLLDYLSQNAPSEFIVRVLSKQNVREYFDPHVYDRHSHDVWSCSTEHCIVQFPVRPWSFTRSYSIPGSYLHAVFPEETVMEDGRTRFEFMGGSLPIGNVEFIFFRHRGGRISDFCYETWLSQACHAFSALRIPREEWKDYALFDDTVYLTLLPDRENQGSYQLDPETPCYLFVLPPPQRPDTTPDVDIWSQGENLYYWSFDPIGDSVMPVDQSRALGLPSYTNHVLILSGTWKPEVYDFMRLWQIAKGFDPATTDFARSMGYPILEIMAADEGKFESVAGGA